MEGPSEPEDGVGLAGSSVLEPAFAGDLNMFSKSESVTDSPVAAASRARRRGAAVGSTTTVAACVGTSGFEDMPAAALGATG